MEAESTAASRFNGAALRRVRRETFLLRDEVPHRSFNGAALRRVRRVAVIPPQKRIPKMLQRGRTPKSAERSGLRLTDYVPALLQRGRTPKSAERRGGHPADGGGSGASTGPHSEECGEHAHSHNTDPPRAASTGPHSEECGENWSGTEEIGPATLQRGRTPKSAESRPALCRSRSSICFNGAALRRVRRAAGSARVFDGMLRFNGAALRRVRRGFARGWTG